MFEKIAYRTMLGAACAGVVAGVGYMIWSFVDLVRSDRKIDRMMDELQERSDRRYAMMEEALMKKIQEEA